MFILYWHKNKSIIFVIPFIFRYTMSRIYYLVFHFQREVCKRDSDDFSISRWEKRNLNVRKFTCTSFYDWTQNVIYLTEQSTYY